MWVVGSSAKGIIQPKSKIHTVPAKVHPCGLLWHQSGISLSFLSERMEQIALGDHSGIAVSSFSIIFESQYTGKHASLYERLAKLANVTAQSRRKQ